MEATREFISMGGSWGWAKTRGTWKLEAWGFRYGVTPLFSGSETPLLWLDCVDRRRKMLGSGTYWSPTITTNVSFATPVSSRMFNNSASHLSATPSVFR